MIGNALLFVPEEDKKALIKAELQTSLPELLASLEEKEKVRSSRNCFGGTIVEVTPLKSNKLTIELSTLKSPMPSTAFKTPVEKEASCKETLVKKKKTKSILQKKASQVKTALLTMSPKEPFRNEKLGHFNNLVDR